MKHEQTIDPWRPADTQEIIARIREKLLAAHCDFAAHRDRIREERKTDRRSLAAGVLIPLLRREAAGGGRGELVLQLIKRSSRVPQGGDLSGPGGMLHPRIDSMLMRGLLLGVPPVVGRVQRKELQRKGRPTREAVMLFLATAMRESWEEIGLNPCNVRFLGPLPCYRLNLYPRTMFPLAILVRKEWTSTLNWEVEKMVEIPLPSFFRNDNYGLLTLDQSPGAGGTPAGSMTFPCFIHRDGKGGEEILWGATFAVILSFLRIGFDYRPPENRDMQRRSRAITPAYLTGTRRAT